MKRFSIDESLRPVRWLRDGHAQSVLPSLPVRRLAISRRAVPLLAASRELILDCGDGVRLQCFIADAPCDDRASIASPVVLLHGWEGSAQSLYVLSLAQRLFAAGHDVVRLNLRDHGETHHLNRELFHSCRLPEVIGAIRALNDVFPSRALALAGFSLGGNFMLRVAAAARGAGLAIDRVVAISPVLDPDATLDQLERGFGVYERYFLFKWRRSLLRKQLAWPDVYDFGPFLRMSNLRAMTAELVQRHTEYDSLAAYLAGYAITGDRLAALAVPSTIVTAADDPIIEAGDLDRLAHSRALHVVVTRHGGHCGFLQRLSQPSWIDDFVLGELHRPR